MITILTFIGLATATWGAGLMFNRIGEQIGSPFWRALMEAMATLFALMLLTIIAVMSVVMLVIVAVLYVRDVVIARRTVSRLSRELLENRMKPFSSYKDNRKRQKAIERADAYLQRARIELRKRNWVGARIKSESGVSALVEAALLSAEGLLVVEHRDGSAVVALNPLFA